MFSYENRKVFVWIKIQKPKIQKSKIDNNWSWPILINLITNVNESVSLDCRLMGKCGLFVYLKQTRFYIMPFFLIFNFVICVFK